jgi:formylglycine-generating enzyme required for sulfatase activity
MIFFHFHVFAQEGENSTLDHQTKGKIIDWVCNKLNENYVFPEVAKKMENHVRKQFKKGQYQQENSIREFTRALTRDLVSICKDEHLRVRINSNPPPPDSASEEVKEKALKERIESDRQENYHFKKIEHLPGNVGYLRFDKFDDPRYAGSTAVAAMNFLANCYALIIDLRYNGGGHETMIHLIFSYFFDEPVHYNNFYIRNRDVTEQHWTSAYVEGPKMTDVDLYVLTSRNTFSAAEGFAYALKNLNRATIVGETTGGGAHPCEYHYLRDLDIELKVPHGRAYFPETGLNWEVAGVEPDVKTSSEKAYQTAYTLALQNLYAKAEGAQKEVLKWKWEYQKALLNPFPVDSGILKSYAGEYGPIRIDFDEGELFVLEPGENEYKRLCALSKKLFVIDGNEEIRGQFEIDENGNVVAIIGIIANGSKQRMPKTTKEPEKPNSVADNIQHGDSAKKSPVKVNEKIFDELGIEFVHVEGGPFQMGDNFEEGKRSEIPVHSVSLDDFYLSKTEVTFAQYDRFCEDTGRENPDDGGWGRGNRPVINVNWNDATAFCQWLSQISGQQIHLPTEAEWEYAAREGGKKVRFGNGQDIADPSEINFDGSAEHKELYSRSGMYRQKTLPVGNFSPNALGLYDMSGNVWEWCADWFDEDYYRYGPTQNPKGPDAGTHRVIRGGTWSSTSISVRCSRRGSYTPDSSNDRIGFRLVRTK